MGVLSAKSLPSSISVQDLCQLAARCNGGSYVELVLLTDNQRVLDQGSRFRGERMMYRIFQKIVIPVFDVRKFKNKGVCHSF